MAKKVKKDFVPLAHEDLDTKNSLLNLARELGKKEGIENIISSVMIYAGMTEYLAQHLLSSLRYFVYQVTYGGSGAVAFLDQRDKRQKRGLGETIDALGNFEFPDKSEIIDLLKKFNKSRTHFFHELIAVNNENWMDYQEDINNITQLTEEFINKLNVVYKGLETVIIPQNKNEEKNT